MQIELPSYQVVEVEGATLRTFRCEPHEATVTTTGCAARFTRAQGAAKRLNGQTYGVSLAAVHSNVAAARAAARHNMDACQRCPLGALHAGAEPVTHSEHYASDQCPRCGFGTNRMIAGRVCVNCYNREREVVAGVNGRGNAPKRIAPMASIPLRLVIGGRVEDVVESAAELHLARVKIGADRKRKPIYAYQERGGLREVICRQLRTTKSAVAFVPRRQDMAAQLRLFA